ncbi:hypothetical protein ACTXT7_017509, partial [Hymenolepis weldensis]
TERENLQVAEKKAVEEKRQRSSLEVSLASEKRARREAENALKAAAAASPFGVISANSAFANSSASCNASNTNNNASALNSKLENNEHEVEMMAWLFSFHILSVILP